MAAQRASAAHERGRFESSGGVTEAVPADSSDGVRAAESGFAQAVLVEDDPPSTGTVSVVVPNGAPGQTISVALPDGRKMLVVVPAEAMVGATLEVEY